jgi:polyisoprenyl-phosphate glycosyltransferase
MKTISLVVPCHNEEAALPLFLSSLAPILEGTGYDYEIVLVDDGSRDATVQTALALMDRYPKIRLVQLSRNFGKEAAMTAGLSYACGDAMIPMDCDLQDPPELIPEMIRAWESGFKVVHAIRRSRKSDTRMKRMTASAFYGLMKDISEVEIPSSVGDFRLMDRIVVNALLAFPERNRFMKGIMAVVGFKAAAVEYDRPERAAGTTKFNFWKLWNFALDGITGFSTFPLRVWTYAGVMVALFSFIYAGWIICKTLLWGVDTPGFATLASLVLFLGGIQLIGIGVLGEYVGRIFAETKRRPIFLVEATHGFKDCHLTTIQPNALERSAAVERGFSSPRDAHDN